MRIDIHNHFAPAEYIEVLLDRKECPRVERRDGGYVMEINRDHQSVMVPGMRQIEKRLEDMDAAGVDVHVVSPCVPAGEVTRDPGLSLALAQAANEGIARIVREHPERFVGMATLPLLSPKEAVRELDRVVNQLGCRAVMLTSNVGGKLLDDQDLWPVYERLEQLGVPAMLHPSWPLVQASSLRQWKLPVMLGFLFDTTVAMSRLILNGVLERFPGLNFILCHLGSTLPWVMGRMDREAGRAGWGMNDRPPSEYFKQVYLDTVCYDPWAIACACDNHGVAKVLFGSDYPWAPMPDMVRDVEGAALAQRDKEAIMSENVRKLLKLA